jgi:class 3 adenylate cyclase
MPETRAAILAADVAGYSRLAAADEERTLARMRALRSDLFDPTIALHHGRVVKRTGDVSRGPRARAASDNPIYWPQRKRFFDGLRTAGVLEA